MIEKLLIRFCAPEVRMLITRLHERPEDFTYHSVWRNLVTAQDGFTRIERKVLANEWAKVMKEKERRARLDSITAQVLNPMTDPDYTLIPVGSILKNTATNPIPTIAQTQQYHAQIKQYEYESKLNQKNPYYEAMRNR